MLTPTHLVTGQTAFLLGSIMTGHAPTLPESFVALLASLIPDMDSRHSYIGRLLPFISEPLGHQFGHRTLTHSLLLQSMVGILAYYILPFGYFLALFTGWMGHSLAD
ncbi:MAG: metal-dependent hydrolase, partial [Halieaceae bacterium]|nr:metal-dependent hydrolase [Halieaceae bacterium]